MMVCMEPINEAASLMGRRSAEARSKKWGKRELVKRMREWLFRRLAANSAGGLGFRQAGDVLPRLVNDVEALDGVYLRILVPLAGALLLLPVAVLVIARSGHGWGAPALAAVIGVLFILAAFVLPWIAARSAMDAGTSLAAAMGQLRIAV